jgi:hypothetical protein
VTAKESRSIAAGFAGLIGAKILVHEEPPVV